MKNTTNSQHSITKINDFFFFWGGGRGVERIWTVHIKKKLLDKNSNFIKKKKKKIREKEKDIY